MSSSALRLSSLVSAVGALIHSSFSLSLFVPLCFSTPNPSPLLSGVSRAPSHPPAIFFRSLWSPSLSSVLHTTPVFHVPPFPARHFSVFPSPSLGLMFSRTSRLPAEMHRDFNTFNIFIIRFAPTQAVMPSPRRRVYSIRMSFFSPGSRLLRRSALARHNVAATRIVAAVHPAAHRPSPANSFTSVISSLVPPAHSKAKWRTARARYVVGRSQFGSRSGWPGTHLLSGSL